MVRSYNKLASPPFLSPPPSVKLKRAPLGMQTTSPTATSPPSPPGLPPPFHAPSPSPATPPGLPPPRHSAGVNAEAALFTTTSPEFGSDWMLPGCAGPGGDQLGDDSQFNREPPFEDRSQSLLVLKPKLSITTHSSGASQHWLSFTTVSNPPPSKSLVLPPPYTPAPSPTGTHTRFTPLHRSKSVPNISNGDLSSSSKRGPLE
ncbi:hypothetical protein ONZ45_g16730 [Pleurotus djamor]|nr:hypothetical protein ONZ45_g16730 [Pleurotus djamor]